MSSPPQVKVADLGVLVDAEWFEGERTGTFAVRVTAQQPDWELRKCHAGTALVRRGGFPSRREARAWGVELMDALLDVLPEATVHWHDDMIPSGDV